MEGLAEGCVFEDAAGALLLGQRVMVSQEESRLANGDGGMLLLSTSWGIDVQVLTQWKASCRSSRGWIARPCTEVEKTETAANAAVAKEEYIILMSPSLLLWD